LKKNKRIVKISRNKDWIVFQFPQREDEIAEFLCKINGATQGRGRWEYGIPSREYEKAFVAIEIFGFEAGDTPTQEAIKNIEGNINDKKSSRKIFYCKDDGYIHIFCKKATKPVCDILSDMSHSIRVGEKEIAIKPTNHNAQNIIRLVKEQFFSIETEGIYKILDNLRGVDKLSMLKRVDDTTPPPIFIRDDIPPRPHQNIGVAALIEFKYFAIFDEMGLGKTFQMIAALSHLFKYNKTEKAIVICPSSLIYTWRDEVDKYSEMDMSIVSGTKKKKLEVINSFIDNDSKILILGYGTTVGADYLNLLINVCQSNRVTLIADESQYIKNPDSKTTVGCLKLSEFAERRYIFTGTPIANKPEDIWSQITFINPNVFGLDRWKFLEKFTLRKDIEIKEGPRKGHKFKLIYGYKNMITIKDRLADISLRRLKDNIPGMPAKVYEKRYVELNASERKLYNEMNSEMIAYFESIDDKTFIAEASNQLVKLGRLTQIASNPAIIHEEYSVTPSKILEVASILEDTIYENKKAIIFTNYLQNIKDLKKHFEALRLKGGPDYNPLFITGDSTSEEKNAAEKMFQSSPEHKIMIATTQAAKTGFTLTAADTAIYMDRSFSLTEWLQSQDRIHRIGQTGTCTIISIIAVKTTDELIDERLASKEKVARFLQGDVAENKDSKLTRKDLISHLKNRKSKVTRS